MKEVQIERENNEVQEEGIIPAEQGIRSDERIAVETEKISDSNQSGVVEGCEEVSPEGLKITEKVIEQTSETELKEDEMRTEVEEELGLESSALAEAQVETKADEEEEWRDVSPGKSSRSPKSKDNELKFGQVAILTNSRFSVLSAEEEEGEIVGDASEEGGIQKANNTSNSGVESMEIMEIKEKEIVLPRQSLPRDSKIKHKVLGDRSVQKAQDGSLSELNKRKPRRN